MEEKLPKICRNGVIFTDIINRVNSKQEIIFGGIRADNEPVLTSRAMSDVCERLNLIISHSVPYEPQMNGKAERMVQTLKSALRATMINVDPKLWDFALEYIVWVWNHTINKTATKC